MILIVICICLVQVCNGQENILDTDSLKVSKLTLNGVDSIKVHGIEDYFSNTATEISTKYTYGIPTQISQKGDINTYRIDLKTGLDIMHLPFTLVGSYSSLTPYSGFGSYFKVDLDISELNRRKELLNSKLKDSLSTQLNKLDKKIFDLESKVLFAKENVISENGKYLKVSDNQNFMNLYQDRMQVDNYEKLSSNDMFNQNQISISSDSIAPTAMDLPDSNLDHQEGDSLKSGVTKNRINIKEYKTNNIPGNRDSIAANVEERIKELQDLIDVLKEKRRLIESQKIAIEEYGKDLGILSNNMEGTISSIIKGIMINAKRFEVGLTRPNNSRYLIRGLPMLGAHLESQIGEYYFSGSGGRIYNPRTYGYILDDNGNKIKEILGLPTQAVKYDAIQLKAGIGEINNSSFAHDLGC